MKEEKLKITVYSDYICPFCYIGFHRIEKLKQQFELDVEWRPFEIHPEIPKEGALIKDLSFPKGYFDMVIANVKKLTEEDGIEVNFSEKLPNTRLALSMAEFARKKGKFDEFHELVFKKFWKEGKDIGNQSLLLDLAESIGLKRDKIIKYLNSNEPAQELKKNELQIRHLGINGVPAFLINEDLIFGAQPHEVFENTIKKAMEEKQNTS